MGLIRRIGRIVRRVVGGAIKGALGFAQKALGGIADSFKSLASGALGGTPFGNLLKGFGRAFLSTPFGLMGAATLGALGALFGRANSHRQLADASQQCCNSPAYEHPYARQNMAALLAYNQARVMAANGWYC